MIGRCSAFASAGVETTGRERIRYGMSRPSFVFPIDPTANGAGPFFSESMKAITSAYVDVSRKSVRSGRVLSPPRTGGDTAGCGAGFDEHATDNTARSDTNDCLLT